MYADANIVPERSHVAEVLGNLGALYGHQPINQLHADANGIGRLAARANPFRWSPWQTLGATLDQLKDVEKDPAMKDRPITMALKYGQEQLETTYANVGEAVVLLREQYDAEEAPTVLLTNVLSIQGSSAGGDWQAVAKKACAPLNEIQEICEGEQCSVQARKKILSKTFNADAELKGKSHLKAEVVGESRADSKIKVTSRDKVVGGKKAGHNLNRKSEVQKNGVSSGTVALEEVREAVQSTDSAKALASQKKIAVVGKAAAVSLVCCVSTAMITSMVTVCLNSYKECRNPCPLVKLRAAFGALATSDAWKQIMTAGTVAGATSMVPALLSGLAEAFTDHAHIFNGFLAGGFVVGGLALVCYQGYNIYMREDLTCSMKVLEFCKEMGSLACGFGGGMLGATIAAPLLAGIPGIILGGVFGCFLGMAFANAWTYGMSWWSQQMQLGDRDALAEVGFIQTDFAIIRTIFGKGTWAGDADTEFMLTVLQNPQDATASDIERAKMLLNSKYRSSSKKKHPDKEGGSHYGFHRLKSSHDALLKRLDQSQPQMAVPLALEQ